MHPLCFLFFTVMSKVAFQLIILGVALVLLQAVVFNHICLFNVAVPFVFICVLLRLPVTLNLNWVFTVGFMLGLAVDLFSDTYGMNALACTLLAALRRPVLRLYVPREQELSRPEPSMYSLGVPAYVKYLTTATLAYCIMIFVIEAFTFFNPWLLVLRIVCSTVLSVVVMLGIDALLTPKKVFSHT